MKKLTLVHWIFISILFGLLCGYAISLNEALSWMLSVADFAATVFLRLLKMVVVPLVITSIITGIVGLGKPENLGRLGFRTITYYLVTSILAIFTGLLVVNLFAPGVGVDLGLQDQVQMEEAKPEDLINIFVRMIPVNFLDAATKGQMLPIIFFCILFGIFITKIDKNYRELLSGFFASCFEVMMKLTHTILYAAPVGIWGLFTKLVATTGFDAYVPLGKYAFCVVLGLLIHAGFTLPLIVFTFARYNPLRFLRHMRFALLTAFSTASSSATLPVTIDCIETEAGVSNRISSFVLPLGATVNMDGTALYECVAVIFIAQVYGVDLSFASQMMVVFTALLASIGAAGIPMAGMVMMSIVLGAVGLPLEGVGLIIAVDRILDMCRTTVNVWSDSCGALTIGAMEHEVRGEV